MLVQDGGLNRGLMKGVVITGSTRGIGLGLAREFLARGCRVVICGRGQESVDQALESLGESERVAGQVCDVTEPVAVQALWDMARSAFNRVDVWINNAGISLPDRPLWEQDPAALRTLVDINVYGLMLGNRVALRGMLEQGGGQIWNMEGFGSGGELRAGMTAYGASKCAVRYLHKSLLKETANTPVQVCTLSPGIVITELITAHYDSSSPEWQRARRVFNILGDRVETVTPWLVRRILSTGSSGARVAWLTMPKAMSRFLTAGFRKRDLFGESDDT